MGPASATVTYYQDESGEWRWNLRAPNNEIIADSGEGYVQRSGAVNGFNTVCMYLGGNPAGISVSFEDDAS